MPSTKTRHLVRHVVAAGLLAVALLGLGSRPAQAALAPATYQEYVGIAGYSIEGARMSDAESVR